jgi:hypothetical protein
LAILAFWAWKRRRKTLPGPGLRSRAQLSQVSHETWLNYPQGHRACSLTPAKIERYTPP